MPAGELEDLIESNSGRIGYERLKTVNGDHFKRVMLDNKQTRFARCIDCELDNKISIIKMAGNSVAGGAFNRHVTSHTKKSESAASTPSIKMFVKREPVETDKSQMADALALFCSKTGASFNRMTSDAAIDLFTEFSQITQNSKGKLDVKALIPNRTTVRNHVSMLAAKINDLDLKTSFCEYGGSVVIDFGKNVHDYFVQVGHFVDRDWNLNVRLLSCETVPGTKTASDIKFFMENALTGLNVQMLVGVSDEGGNVKDAIRELFPFGVNCTAHVLNTVCKHIFSPYVKPSYVAKIPDEFKLDSKEEEVLNTAAELFSDVKKVAGYACSINFKDRAKVVSFVETRFLSHLPCIRSVVKLLNEVAMEELKLKIKAPTVKPLLSKLSAKIDEMMAIVKVLEVFEPFFDKLEGEKKVTSIKVTITYVQIKQSLEKLMLDSNSEFARVLSKSALAALSVKKDHFYNTVWKLAQVFDPWTKHFNKVLSEREKLEVKDLLRKMMASNPLSDVKPVVKRIRLNHNDDDFGGNPNDFNGGDQLDEYYGIPCAQQDPLTFWKENEGRFLELAILARKFLSVPASSASVERAFSLIRNFVGDNRKLLDPGTVFDMLKIRFNYSS